MTTFNETFDFVVIGSGGGSMCAALVLRQAGKSVLVLEKTPLLGGTTARSGGVMWIPNNRFMKRDGIPDSVEQAVTYLEAVSGGRNDTPGSTAERRRTYVEQGSRMVDFLVEQGVRLTRVPLRDSTYRSSWPGPAKPKAQQKRQARLEAGHCARPGRDHGRGLSRPPPGSAASVSVLVSASEPLLLSGT